ncbi:MAG: peptide chain release factor-like protein [Leptospirales bacterium]|jgi:hypothetical protein
MSASDLAAFYTWLALPPEDLLAQCTRTPYQASGPGGQKRNRVYSALRLEHSPTGIRAESGAHREAARNRKDALRKLRLALAIAGSRLVPLPLLRGAGTTPEDPLDLPEAPDAYPAFRAKVSAEHQDFPATVLKALVVFRGFGGELRPTAARLGVSPSAFGRYLKIDKFVFAEANRIRAAASLARLS